MNKGIYIGLGIFIAVVVFGFIFFSAPKEKIVEVVSSAKPVATEVSSSVDATIDSKEAVKVIQVAGKDFSYDLSTANVKKGERIKIEFINNGKMDHDFRIEELNIGTKILKTGESETIEFTVPESGSLTYFCSVGSHRLLGMEGEFIIQ